MNNGPHLPSPFGERQPENVKPGSGAEWNNAITRRSFLKRTGGATVATIVTWHGTSILSSAQNPPGGGSGQKKVVSKSEYQVVVDGPTHIMAQGESPPNEESYSTHPSFNPDRDHAESEWPENTNPNGPSNSTHVDNDYIWVDGGKSLKKTEITTNPSIDDTTPEIIVDGNAWHFRWTFTSVVTYTYE